MSIIDINSTLYRYKVIQQSSNYNSSYLALKRWVGLDLLLQFCNSFFNGVGLLASCPTPNLEGQDPFLSGSSPMTCLACETIPVAYATASIVLWIICPHKPQHYAKVGIPLGGVQLLIEVQIMLCKYSSHHYQSISWLPPTLYIN